MTDWTKERRERRRKQRYAYLRINHPALFRRCVELGSVVTFERLHGNVTDQMMRLAARVEQAAVDLVHEALDVPGEME